MGLERMGKPLHMRYLVVGIGACGPRIVGGYTVIAHIHVRLKGLSGECVLRLHLPEMGIGAGLITVEIRPDVVLLRGTDHVVVIA